MTLAKLEEIVSYSDDENVYCPDCVDDITGLEAIFRVKAKIK